MRIRKRLSDELKARLLATLPEAVETVWDHVAVVVAVEQITFTSAGGFEREDWARHTEFKGVVMAELRADAIDDLEVEPLIGDLVENIVFLDLPADAEPGTSSEKCRAILADWRDVIRDTQIASKLRFTVEGVIATRQAPAVRPELLLGVAPEIGPEHEGAYTAITDLAGGAA